MQKNIVNTIFLKSNMQPIISIFKTITNNEERVIYYKFHNRNCTGEIIEENLCGKCGVAVKTEYIPQVLYDLTQNL